MIIIDNTLCVGYRAICKTYSFIAGYAFNIIYAVITAHLYRREFTHEILFSGFLYFYVVLRFARCWLYKMARDG